MILPLRKRHRIVFTGLAFLVPLIFAAGFVSRPSLPVAAPAGKGFLAEARYGTLIWERSDLWDRRHILTRMKSNGEGGFAIEFSTIENLLQPDLLLYWSTANSSIYDSLPEDAVLLGSAMPGIPVPLNLPAEIRGRPGRLVLYSLANHEVVAASGEILPTSGSSK